MTHSAFTAIPVHPATEAAHLTDLAARYRQALTAEPGAGKRSVKQLAKMIDAFETRARTLLDHRTDDGVWFEHLGADFVMVDESHYFKNLGVPVRTDGFSVAASKRATDLDMKLGLLRERGGRSGAMFTGTPVSNSLLEMYVLQHYLQPAGSKRSACTAPMRGPRHSWNSRPPSRSPRTGRGSGSSAARPSSRTCRNC